MRKYLFLAVAPLLLVACTVRGRLPADADKPAIDPPIAYVASSSVPEPDPVTETVLVDSDYTGVNSLHGKEWLQRVHTRLLRGDLRDAELQIELSRGEKLTGWAGIGIYLAETTTWPNGKVYPDETRFGTRMRYIGAEWNGDCQRHLAPSSSFGVLREHSNTITVPLNAVPVTQGIDGCQTGTETLNLLEMINGSTGNGLFLAFAPSDDTYHVKVTLRYRGHLAVDAF